MRKIKTLKPLTDGEIQRLTKIMECCNSKRGSQFGDWKKTKKICEIIFSLNEGKSAQDVANEYNVGRTTVFSYIKKYNENPYFMTHQKKRQASILEKYEFEIARLLREKHITEYKEAHRVITEKYEVNISYERTRAFLISHDFFKDKNKNCINHKRNSATKHRMTERNTVTPLISSQQNSYLMEHLDEIERYGMKLVDSYEGDNTYLEYNVVKEIKNRYPEIKETDSEVRKILKRQTSVF